VDDRNLGYRIYLRSANLVGVRAFTSGISKRLALYFRLTFIFNAPNVGRMGSPDTNLESLAALIRGTVSRGGLI
jgi:hypothetical protein